MAQTTPKHLNLRDLLGFFLQQDGLATLHEVCMHFTEIDTPLILSAWDELIRRKRIGILLHKEVVVLRDGMIVYSLSRSPHPVYRVMMR